MTDRSEIIVTMNVTEPQAIALTAMFEYWNWLSAVGGSRRVAFYVDGDGDFHPKCRVTKAPAVNERHRKLAVIEDKDGNRVYDYDPVAWDMTE